MMPQPNDPQQPGQDPAAAEPDALDALDEALADDPASEAEPDEWTPPTREEWEAAQAAHRAEVEKEQAKLKRAREQARRLREGRPAGTEGSTQPQPADAGASPDIAVWQARAVRTAAKAELLARGADPDMVDLAVARLRPAEIQFDEDDEPDLDEWLDDMQTSYPKLFQTATAPSPAPQRRPGRVDQGAAAAGPPARPQMSLGEQIIARSEAARRAGSRSRL